MKKDKKLKKEIVKKDWEYFDIYIALSPILIYVSFVLYLTIAN